MKSTACALTREASRVSLTLVESKKRADAADLRRPAAQRIELEAFEERVAFELRFDIGDEVEARELEQLDGLQELRRHHQGLALAHFQPM